MRRRTGPTRMRDFAEQREQEISTWVNTELLEKLKNKTLNLPPDLQSIASPDIEKWTYKKCNPDRLNTVELIVCFSSSTDCMCALIAGI